MIAEFDNGGMYVSSIEQHTKETKLKVSSRGFATRQIVEGCVSTTEKGRESTESRGRRSNSQRYFERLRAKGDNGACSGYKTSRAGWKTIKLSEK